MIVVITVTVFVSPTIATTHISLVLVSILVITSWIVLPVEVLLFVVEISLVMIVVEVSLMIVIVEITVSTTVIIRILTLHVLWTVLVPTPVVVIVIVMVERSSFLLEVVVTISLTVRFLQTRAIIEIALAIFMVLLASHWTMTRMLCMFYFYLPLIESI